MLEASELLRTDRATGQVLLDVPHLQISAGERVGVQGPSGSGKSLLLRALAWLDRLDRGEIRYQGRRIHSDRLPDFRRRVVYLHQAPSLDGATVEAALKSPFRLRVHQHKHYARTEAVAALDGLGRNDRFLDKATGDLSGGEKLITALVRALLLEPEMLLLDEPTAALDAATTGHVERVICDWVGELPDHRAALWVSHDKDQTKRLATRVLRVEAGRLETSESGRK